jgi:predicted acetyltransferase
MSVTFQPQWQFSTPFWRRERGAYPRHWLGYVFLLHHERYAAPAPGAAGGPPIDYSYYRVQAPHWALLALAAALPAWRSAGIVRARRAQRLVRRGSMPPLRLRPHRQRQRRVPGVRRREWVRVTSGRRSWKAGCTGMRLERVSDCPPAGLAEFLKQLGGGEGGFGGTSFGRGEADLDAFLRWCLDGEDPAKVPAGFVPQTVFWLIAGGGELVGMVRVRHRLNDRLLQSGGHVGYYVRRSERGKGYGTRALALALDRLRGAGVRRALVTVDPTNEPSNRVALANGGKLDGQGRNDAGVVVNRYWVEL